MLKLRGGEDIALMLSDVQARRATNVTRLASGTSPSNLTYITATVLGRDRVDASQCVQYISGGLPGSLANARKRCFVDEQGPTHDKPEMK